MEYTLESMFGVKDKVVVITGGCGGIGSGLAQALGKLGARVALLDRSPEKLEATAAKLRNETGAEVRGYTASVTDEVSVEEAFAQIERDFGSVYGLINCAGISHVQYLSKMDIDRWQAVMDVNVRGTVICAKVAAAYMAKQRVGRIINVSSLASTHGKPQYTAYTPSKAAVDGFTITLATELAHKGITVNSVRPVFMLTDINRAQYADDLNGAVARAIARNPQARCCSPELLAGLVVFLLSESSSYVDGQLIGCDGGSTYGDISNLSYQPEEYET